MDYGKLAYIKQEDMNKRLMLLENTSVNATLQSIILKNINENKLTALITGYEYYFELKKNSQISLKLNFKLSVAVENSFTVKILIDDILASSEQFLVKANVISNFECVKNIPSLCAGTKKINIQIIFDTPPTDAKLNGMFVEVYGKGLVRMYNTAGIDYCANNTSRAYALNAKNCEIFTSTIDGLFLSRKKLSEKKRFKILYSYKFSNKITNDSLIYFFTDFKNNLYMADDVNQNKFILNNVEDFTVLTEKFGDCSGIVFLITQGKLGYVKISIFDDKTFVSNFIEIETQLIKPKKVFATSINGEKYLIVECNGKSKLIKIAKQLSETEVNCLKFNLSLACGGEF